jgi:hypothetical protein
MHEILSYMSTPTATVREKILALLEAEITDIKIYPEFPNMQPAMPSIVMQQFAGSTREIGVGQNLNSTVKAHFIRLWFQFDVYHNTAAKRDEYADKIINALWENRATLKADGIDLYPSSRIQDLPPDAVGSRLYRKSFDFLFTIYMTAAVT